MALTANLEIPPEAPLFASTGIEGLDAILCGGLPRGEMHLAQGSGGAGKTTLGLSFLRAGAKDNEPVLYVTLAQSAGQLRRIARSFGWSLHGVTIHELTPGAVAERVISRQTVLATQDVELVEVFQELVEAVERVKPRRAVVDSISILQLLAGGLQRYQAEIVALRQLFIEHECTVLLLTDNPPQPEKSQNPDLTFHPLSGCVIHLEQALRPYGEVRRSVVVVKARGVPHKGGRHDMKIRSGGMEVYPRLDAYGMSDYRGRKPYPSGITVLDELSSGGLEAGTTTLIVGPAGTGKSTVASRYAVSAANRGENAVFFLFDERPEAHLIRAEGMGIPLRSVVEEGRVTILQQDPGEVVPGEFARDVRREVEARGTKVVVIDSVNGYFNSMAPPETLTAQLHELLTYLNKSGVVTLLCGAQEGFMSIGIQPGPDISYVSDTILVLGYFEADGALRRWITVQKKKLSPHETTIHELFLTSGGVGVAREALSQFRHIVLPNATRNGAAPAGRR